VGIASSPDFTQTIYTERLTENQREQMLQQGYILSPSKYQDNPIKITRKLITDGKKHLLLHHDNIDLNIPVCLIHGKKDADVSWKKSEQLYQLIGKEHNDLVLIPDGEHRLSRKQDLKQIDEAVQKISAQTIPEL
jgi:alpha-beta hydrolase superfamily lysophospholipase